MKSESISRICAPTPDNWCKISWFAAGENRRFGIEQSISSGELISTPHSPQGYWSASKKREGGHENWSGLRHQRLGANRRSLLENIRGPSTSIIVTWKFSEDDDYKTASPSLSVATVRFCQFVRTPSEGGDGGATLQHTRALEPRGGPTGLLRERGYSVIRILIQRWQILEP